LTHETQTTDSPVTTTLNSFWRIQEILADGMLHKKNEYLSAFIG